MGCWVYILRSVRTGRLYVGHTNDLGRRIEEHNRVSRNAYCSKRGPWTLAYKEEHPDRRSAMARERFLKSVSGSREKKRLAGVNPD